MQTRRFLSVPHVERHAAELALLIALAALLELAGSLRPSARRREYWAAQPAAAFTIASWRAQKRS
jgi:hypothetical protein